MAIDTTKKPASAGGRMRLSGVLTGRHVAPLRVLLYGVEGIGKTTFAAGAPAPIFLGNESGFGTLSVARFPEPGTWSEVGEAVRALTTEEHEYKTLVLDTLDWLEPLCWAEVCRRGGHTSIEDPGYGKGYVAALEHWRVLLSQLEELRRAKAMHVVMLAHAKLGTFANPEGDDYNRYSLKLNDKAAGLFKEWSDAVLFANYQTGVKAAKGGFGKGKGTGGEARVVYTARRAAFDAKNRQGLPATLPLEWDAFQRAANLSADELLAELRELAPRLRDADLRQRVVAHCEANSKDVGALGKGLTRVRELLEEQDRATESTGTDSKKEQ